MLRYEKGELYTDTGAGHPKWKAAARAEVVNEHVIFEKEKRIEWNWITMNGERVAGEAGGDSLDIAL